MVKKGADIFKGYRPEAEKKYGCLKKERWKDDPDKTFEAHEFDPDGTLATLQWKIQKQPADWLIIWEEMPEAHRHIRRTKAEKKTMWFIPNEPPLTEPPNLAYRDPAYLDNSYIQFPEEYHDKPPDDREWKARLKDLEAEQMALGMYFPGFWRYVPRRR